MVQMLVIQEQNRVMVQIQLKMLMDIHMVEQVPPQPPPQEVVLVLRLVMVQMVEIQLKMLVDIHMVEQVPPQPPPQEVVLVLVLRLVMVQMVVTLYQILVQMDQSNPIKIVKKLVV
jgi:hypothetical protein